MISKPSTPQLIDATCAELASKAGPAIDDPTVKVVLEMAQAVLHGASIRSANEVAWMRAEADATEEVARRFVADLPDPTALAAALQTYLDAKTDSLYLADVQADYARASEVLSCAAEAAYADGDAERIAAVGSLFDQRMTNENTVTGVFIAAGRT